MLAALTHNLLLGGASGFLLNLLRALAGGPERVRIVCFGEENEHAADFAALRADVRQAPLRRLIYEDRLLWAYREVAESRPRAVLACLGSESFEITRIVPPGVARIGLVQADDAQVYAMAARYHASLDAMVGVSQEIGEKLRAMPEFRGKRIEAIPYGIAFAPAAERPVRAPGEPLRLLYFGRLIEEQKRISRIVELARALEASGAPVRFTIAGSGPQEAGVRAALAGCAVATVSGALPNADVPALLREHDVFVLLSDYEGLPLSLLEAMGEGVVPVISDLPSGIAQAVVVGSGLRVPVGEVAAAREAILSLAADPARLAALSRAAMAHARAHFSAERMAARYLGLIDSLASAGKIEWPTEIVIPAPFGVNPWLYSGWRRTARRILKRPYRSFGHTG